MIKEQLSKKPAPATYVMLAILIATCCFGLGYIDHETKQFSDLLTAQNLAALSLYFIPTFLVCAGLHTFFSKKRKPADSILLSLLAGVPLTFILMIILLLSLRR
ncbi:MAG TPA: hypothetical protein VL092_07325 [Chitinophagaceae bacterium]|nr:hypothetical protein [Chitinophagaceae bacterium]